MRRWWDTYGAPLVVFTVIAVAYGGAIWAAIKWGSSETHSTAKHRRALECVEEGGEPELCRKTAGVKARDE